MTATEVLSDEIMDIYTGKLLRLNMAQFWPMTANTDQELTQTWGHSQQARWIW